MLLKNLLPQFYNYLPEIEVTGLTCDSRKVEKGFAFVCINGSALDGHDYALKAEELGAAVVISEKPTGAKNEVIVEDTHAAYALMSAAFFGYPSKDLKLIGVTGTYGKT